MSKIDITRTELVWPGKYDEDGNLVTPPCVNLPFQVIERSDHVVTLFDYWRAEEERTPNRVAGGYCPTWLPLLIHPAPTAPQLN